MHICIKFLKNILSNNHSLGEYKTTQLNLNYSARLSKTLSSKLKDPEKFIISCILETVTIKKALYDLGASVSLMSHTIFEQMGIGKLKPTRMTIQLADASVRLPLRIEEDVLV